MLSYSQFKGQAHRAKTKVPVGSTSDKLKKYRSPILEQAKDTISDLTVQQSYLLELEDWGAELGLHLHPQDYGYADFFRIGLFAPFDRRVCPFHEDAANLPCMFFKARAFSILPSQKSGGKDKTMMNMMTGAVAINGGVGVMEIHQPQVAVSQMAASAAQAAEQVALNAHITLREMKTKIDTVVEKKLPTFKTLMEKEPVAVAQTMVNGAKLTAYENGYAVYEVDGSHTVMAVDRCNDYRYDFTDGTYEVIPAETFEDVEWSVRLLMEGERRMEHNLNKRVADSENVSLECDGSDWSAAVMVDFLDEDNAEMLADRELRRLYAAMSKLTERQTEVIQLYFYKGMTLQEIAEELGITKPAVHYAMKGALKKMRKSF